MDKLKTGVSDTLRIGFDFADSEDVAVLAVWRYSGSKIECINLVYGKEAERLYSQLIGTTLAIPPFTHN